MRKGSHQSEETRKRLSEINKGKKPSEETRKKLSIKTKQRIKDDPDFYHKLITARKGKKASAETLQKLSRAMKEKFEDPVYREKMEKILSNRNKSPEQRLKISEIKKGNKNMLGHRHSEATKERMSKSAMGNKSNKGKHFSEEHRRKLSEGKKGDKNPSWINGEHKRKYCFRFNEHVKEFVRTKFGRKCFLCPTTEAKNGRKLAVHHCDYDKGQGCGQRWSLLPLCQRCHLKTNFNRYYYFNLLSNYWALNPEINEEFTWENLDYPT